MSGGPPSGAGMSAINEILQSGNTTRIAKANYYRNTELQKAGNKLKKAQGDLATWARSLGNQRIVKGAEENYNSQMMTLTNEMKNAEKSGSNLSLQYAEAMGRVRAQAAMAGVGGTSVEMADHLVSLQNATTQQELIDSISNMAFFGKEQAASIVADAYNSQDFSQDVVEYDTFKYKEPKDLKYKYAKLVGIAAAYIWGGPMAGDAAAQGTLADWKASNGDFPGAVKSYTGAFNSGMASAAEWAKTYKANSPKPQPVQREAVSIYKPERQKISWFGS